MYTLLSTLRKPLNTNSYEVTDCKMLCPQEPWEDDPIDMAM
jgi:hypothetical protein